MASWMTRHSYVLGIVVIALGACGRSPIALPDDAGGTDTEGTTTTDVPSTTDDGPSTTDDGPSTTDDSGTDTTTGEPEPEPKTCRDAIECMTGCLLGGNFDIDCFSGCIDGLPPDEGQLALELGTCAVTRCFDNGTCSVDDLQNMDCLTCIGFGLIAPEPTGCEDEALACM